MPELTDTPDIPGALRWLSPAAAGRHLGITERTVRRRIQAGLLPVRRGPGGRMLVGLAPDIADVADISDMPPDVAPDTAPDAVTVLAELLREERAARSQAEQAAAMWQERARNLEARVDALLALPEHVPESPPWWHRLFRRGR